MRNAQTTEEILTNKLNHIFLAQGFGKTSMAKLAEMTDVSRQTLYQYFNNKNEIIAEVVAYHLNFMAENPVPKVSTLANLPHVLLSSFLLIGGTTDKFLKDLRNYACELNREFSTIYNQYCTDLTNYYLSAQQNGLMISGQDPTYLLFQNVTNIHQILLAVGDQRTNMTTGERYLINYFHFFVSGALTAKAQEAIDWTKFEPQRESMLRIYYDTYNLIPVP